MEQEEFKNDLAKASGLYKIDGSLVSGLKFKVKRHFFGTEWNADSSVPTKHDLYAKFLKVANELSNKVGLSGDQSIAGIKTFLVSLKAPHAAYGSDWENNQEVPTKWAVYEKIETLGGSGDMLGANNLSDVADADTSLNNLGVYYGVWTPTLTDGANVTGSTATACQYTQIGNVVTFSGAVAVEHTVGATYTVLDLSLPVASNFAFVYQLGGVAACVESEAVNIFGQLHASVADNRIILTYVSDPADATERALSFSGSYKVV